MSDSHEEAQHSFDESYGDTKDMFGKPYEELQYYFKNQPIRGSVLDLGCGQGRDALFLAEIGYEVTAVDSSKVGVEQMLQKAQNKNLQVEGLVADIVEARIEKKYDVILFDMVLHGFPEAEQIDVLKKYSGNLKENGSLCIVFPDDMNTDYFMSILNSLEGKWKLKDEIVIKDIPKLQDEEIDFTFVMICAQQSSGAL